jgi:hypothetical protein
VTLTAPNTSMLDAATLAAQAARIAAPANLALSEEHLARLITGADPSRVNDALTGFPIAIRSLP